MDTQHMVTAPLAELHAHLTTAIPPAVFWHLAHTEGYKLPKREYREFVNHIVLSEHHKMTLKSYLDEIYHPILNKLASGAPAVEKATYASFGGAYRSNNITLFELRMNPMKHNHEGSVDLDHVIMASLRGMEKALLEYRTLRAGIIFCLDRQFSVEQNAIIVEKAIKYRKRGVIAIDFANYNSGGFHFKDYEELIAKARSAGLKVTAHSGETDDTNDLWDCVTYARPDRIGHGIKAAYDQKLMEHIASHNIVLEVCPLGNLMTKAVKNLEEMKFIIQTLLKNNVKLTINTDWPETVENNHLRTQFEFLLQNGIMTEAQVHQSIQWAFESTFIDLSNPHENLYLG